MATEEEIMSEVRSLGRLSPHQEDVLYSIALKQDELGRESTCLLLDKLAGNPLYEPLIEREYLTYDTFDHGGVNRVASLYVTLKGLRYCILFPPPWRAASPARGGAVTRREGAWSADGVKGSFGLRIRRLQCAVI